MQYEFSDTQVKNLRIFLDRVDLKGAEAVSLVEIKLLLNQGKDKNEKPAQEVITEPKEPKLTDKK